jgi:translocator protein
MNMSDVVKLVVSLVLCEGAGVAGSLFTVPAVKGWYQGLKKPPFTPPNWLFGPVWTTLYLLMGLAVYLLWRQGLSEGTARLAFIIFWVQLALNVSWSAVFFGRRSLSGGLAVIVVLWLTILATIIVSFGVSAASAWLLVPYLAWVSIATYLNAGVWWLNRRSQTSA